VTFFLAKNVLQFIGNQNHIDQTYKEYVHPLENEAKAVTAVVVVSMAGWFLEKEMECVVAFILNIMNPVDALPHTFNDYSWRCLPNDDLTYIDTWIRVQFTEIWIDIQYAAQVISYLQDLYKSDPIACGNFGCEVYSAKKSPFWMSMSYDRDVI